LPIKLIEIPDSGELLDNSLELIIKELKIQIDDSLNKMTENINDLLLLVI
jgi:hypothetical protein